MNEVDHFSQILTPKDDSDGKKKKKDLDYKGVLSKYLSQNLTKKVKVRS